MSKVVKQVHLISCSSPRLGPLYNEGKISVSVKDVEQEEYLTKQNFLTKISSHKRLHKQVENLKNVAPLFPYPWLRFSRLKALEGCYFMIQGSVMEL